MFEVVRSETARIVEDNRSILEVAALTKTRNPTPRDVSMATSLARWLQVWSMSPKIVYIRRVRMGSFVNERVAFHLFRHLFVIAGNNDPI